MVDSDKIIDISWRSPLKGKSVSIIKTFLMWVYILSCLRIMKYDLLLNFSAVILRHWRMATLSWTLATSRKHYHFMRKLWISCRFRWFLVLDGLQHLKLTHVSVFFPFHILNQKKRKNCLDASFPTSFYVFWVKVPTCSALCCKWPASFHHKRRKRSNFTLKYLLGIRIAYVNIIMIKEALNKLICFAHN